MVLAALLDVEQHRTSGTSCRDWREFAVPPNGGVSSRVSEGRGWLRSDLKHAAAALTAAMVIAAACPLHVSWFQTLALACHLEHLHLRIRRNRQLCSTAAYPMDALDELRAIDRMCGCVLVSLCARFSRDCSCRRTWSIQEHIVKTHVPGSRNARGLCKSGYTVSLICHVRPLFHRETGLFQKNDDAQKSRFCANPCVVTS